MKRFAYGRDTLCRLACLCYAANRWALPVALKHGFMRNHFNDVLLIPSALPWMLWLQRRLGLRDHDAPPDWREVLFHTAVWALAAEVAGPRLFAQATADPWDIAAYVMGAVVATLTWRFR